MTVSATETYTASTSGVVTATIAPMTQQYQFDCMACGRFTNFMAQSCLHCHQPRPSQLIVSNADLAHYITNSSVSSFSLDINFLLVLLSQQKLNATPNGSSNATSNANAIPTPSNLTRIRRVNQGPTPNLHENKTLTSVPKGQAASSSKVTPIERVSIDNTSSDDDDDDDDFHSAVETNYPAVSSLPSSRDHRRPASTGTRFSKNQIAKRTLKRAIRGLSDHIPPGLHILAPEPAIYANLGNNSQMKRASAVLEADLARYFTITCPEYAHEMTYSLPLPNTLLTVDTPECISGVPSRIEAGYYKAHLTSQFVKEYIGDNSCLPHGMRVKRKTNQKAIAFFSTIKETICNTHYDLDPSFLFVLKGKKQLMYAPPAVAKMYGKCRVVESHSSIFEGVNPFDGDHAGAWECVTLTAGDGLMLPQNWLHSVKSSPGTLAISFQVESTGEVKQSLPETTKPSTKRRRSSPTLLMAPPPPAIVVTKQRKTSASNKSKVMHQNMTIPPVENEKPSRAVKTTVSDIHMNQPLKTKKPLVPITVTEQPAVAKVVNLSARKSNRVTVKCGMHGCNNSFLHGGLMWMLIRRDFKAFRKLLPEKAPLVPTALTKHLICFDCEPQMGREVINPDDVLDGKERQELEGWIHYVYCPASRGDYKAQADKEKMY